MTVGQLFLILIVIAIVSMLIRNRTLAVQGGSPERPIGDGIVVREYKGKLADATAQFQRDAALMAVDGYYPISQVYQPGSWGCGAFLVALVLFVVLVGILIFLYMLIVKPAGSLVVTYQWRAAPRDAR